jgi:2-polyprenyl-3-methyl-5-hydroxy-6-metoxy-1,4-benzoquinol methylase
MNSKQNNSCYLCSSKNFHIRPGLVRDNQSISILECSECGLVYLSSFDHINSKHYENSGMHNDNQLDYDSWIEDTKDDDRRRFEFLIEKITNKRVLDFGCGAGGFLDIAKPFASKVDGIELEKALQSRFMEKELNVFSSIEEAKKNGAKWDLITSFHVVEHLPDPKKILKEIANLLTNEGELIIEVPNSNDVLLSLYENQKFQSFTYWSQHLFLYSQKTLTELIRQSGYKLHWVKHVQRYPLSNHLYWLAKGQPGGHKKWDFMNSKALDAEYENKLASLQMTDTIIASISKM